MSDEIHDPYAPASPSAPLDYTDESAYRRTRAPATRAVTIIPDAYREPAFWAVERERVFARTWIPVTVAAQFARNNQAHVAELAGRSIILWRNRRGELRAFHNVCRHRGTQLLPSGTHKLDFNGVRCPYHSWAYDLDGRCMGTPYFEGSRIPREMETAFDMASVEGFDKRDYGLLPVRIAEWGPLVFVNLDPQAEPLATQLGDLTQRFSAYRLQEWRLQRSHEYAVSANYKLIGENFMECYHLPWVHPELTPVSPVDNHYRWQGRGLYTGMCTMPIGTDTASGGWQSLPPYSALSGDDADSGRFVWLFPNAAMAVLPNHAFVVIAHPEGPGKTREETFLLTQPEVNDNDGGSEYAVDQLATFWDLVNRQDVDIVERVQAGLNDGAFPGGRLCYHFEEPIHRFQNMLIDKMVAIDRVPDGDARETIPMFRQRD